MSFRSHLQVGFICRLVYNGWCIKMPGQESTETNQFFMNWLKSRKIAMAWWKPLRSSIMHHETEVNCQQSDRSVMCLWGMHMDDGAVTWHIKCTACLGPQGLALHYGIIAEGFEGRLWRVFDNESWVLCSACKVTWRQVLDSAKLISSWIVLLCFCWIFVTEQKNEWHQAVSGLYVNSVSL